jgi:hypothetical protein
VITTTAIGTMGAGAMLNNVTGIERRVFATEEPIGTFSAHDFMFLLNFSRKVSENISFGLNAKFLHEKIYIESASGLAFDFGCRYLLHASGVFLAASLQNIGYTTEMVRQRVNLPETARLGASYTLPLSLSWHIAADVVKFLDEAIHVNIGTEVWPIPELAIRAGYQTGYEEKGLSAGFGLKMGWFSIDYAYVPFQRDLGESQRFSFTTYF